MIDIEGLRAGLDAEPQQKTPSNRIHDTDTTDTFWSVRPVLTHIHQFARARRVSPDAVLAVVLARVIVATPHFVMLPALVGGHGSLNLFVGLVGPSGKGKGAAAAVAAECVVLPNISRANVGSGEGIGHLFKKKTKTKDDGYVEEWIRREVLMEAQEIDTLTALGSRNASNLLPELRKAWSGEPLGFAYADPTKRLDIGAHEYRLGLVAGIQPGRAQALLDDTDGGTPQRFIWASVLDPEAPDVAPDEPGPWQWKHQDGDWYRDAYGRVVLPVCDLARDYIDEQRLRSLRGEGDALDGHGPMAHLKMAAALSLLDGRAGIEEEDWNLAGFLATRSDRTRQSVVDTLTDARVSEGRQRAESAGRSAVVTEDVRYEEVVRQVCTNLQNLLPVTGYISGSKLRKGLRSTRREYFTEAVRRLAAVGNIVCRQRQGIDPSDKEDNEIRVFEYARPGAVK